MAERKADVFAGEGSIAGMLRKRRKSMEEFDPEAALQQPQKEMPDAPDMQASVDDRRGYTKDKWGN